MPADNREPAQPRGLRGEHVIAGDAGDHEEDRDRELRLVRRAAVLRLLIFFVSYQSMAGQEGIEPPTCGFGDRRSAN